MGGRFQRNTQRGADNADSPRCLAAYLSGATGCSRPRHPRPHPKNREPTRCTGSSGASCRHSIATAWPGQHQRNSWCVACAVAVQGRHRRPTGTPGPPTHAGVVLAQEFAPVGEVLVGRGCGGPESAIFARPAAKRRRDAVIRPVSSRPTGRMPSLPCGSWLTGALAACGNPALRFMMLSSGS